MIDPNIALNVRQSQAQDPLEGVSKVLTLRALLAQGPLREQQLQAAKLENEQRSQALGATRAMNEAFQGSVNPDGSLNRDQITSALASRGYGSQIPGVLKHFADAERSIADVRKVKGEIAAAEADYAGSIAAAARAAKDDPDVLLAGLSHAKAMGYDSVAPLIGQVQNDPANAKAIIDRLIQQSPKQRQLLASESTAAARAVAAETGQAREKREADLQPGRVKQQALEATKLEQATTGTTPETPHELAMRTQQERHNRVEEGQGAQRVRTAQLEQGLRQKSFDATYGALVDPATGKPLEGEAAKRVAESDPLAVAVANYQTPPPTVGSRGIGAPIMRKVLAINPDYDAKTWRQQGDILRDFTTGKTSQTLSATNRALGHLNLLADAADALDGSNLQVINRIANEIGVQVGKDATTTFRTIVHRVGPEIAAAYGEGTGGERGKVESDFDPALGPKQIKSNLGATAKLFRSKLAPDEQRWKSVMGNRAMPLLLTGEADRAMQRLAPTTGGLQPGQTVTLKDGKTGIIETVHPDGSFDLKK